VKPTSNCRKFECMVTGQQFHWKASNVSSVFFLPNIHWCGLEGFLVEGYSKADRKTGFVSNPPFLVVHILLMTTGVKKCRALINIAHAIILGRMWHWFVNHDSLQSLLASTMHSKASAQNSEQSHRYQSQLRKCQPSNHANHIEDNAKFFQDISVQRVIRGHFLSRACRKKGRQARGGENEVQILKLLKSQTWQPHYKYIYESFCNVRDTWT